MQPVTPPSVNSLAVSSPSRGRLINPGAQQPIASNPVERPNLSNLQPMSSAAMNNNPQGVQQVMQPVAPSMPNGPSAFQPMAPSMPDGPTTPSRASLIQANPYMRQPVSSPSRAMLLQGNPFKPMQASSLETALAQDSTYVNPAADKSYDGPRINPFLKPQGRDPQNPSQFAPQNIQPGSGNFVDQGGQTQPRQDISMARNLMAGQPEGGSRSFGQPMNVPGATQTLGGQVVSPPQRYGQEGVIPGAFRGMTPAEGDMHGISPDAFRVATGGQPMIPYVPSGVQPTDGQASRQATIANRNARARGVRGSDVAQWRATNPMALMQKEAVANQAAINTSNVAANNWLNQGNMLSQPEGQQFSPTSPSVNPFAQAASPSATPGVGFPIAIDKKWLAPGLFTSPEGPQRPQLPVPAPDNWLIRNAQNPFRTAPWDRPNQRTKDYRAY